MLYWVLALAVLIQTLPVPEVPIRYRLLRVASSRPVTPQYPEYGGEVMQDVVAASLVCDLPYSATFTGWGFRIEDPGRPGRDCQWSAPATDPIFSGKIKGVIYTYSLSAKYGEYEPWAGKAGIGAVPGQSLRFRMNPPPGMQRTP